MNENWLVLDRTPPSRPLAGPFGDIIERIFSNGYICRLDRAENGNKDDVLRITQYELRAVKRKS